MKRLASPTPRAAIAGYRSAYQSLGGVVILFSMRIRRLKMCSSHLPEGGLSSCLCQPQLFQRPTWSEPTIFTPSNPVSNSIQPSRPKSAKSRRTLLTDNMTSSVSIPTFPKLPLPWNTASVVQLAARPAAKDHQVVHVSRCGEDKSQAQKKKNQLNSNNLKHCPKIPN